MRWLSFGFNRAAVEGSTVRAAHAAAGQPTCCASRFDSRSNFAVGRWEIGETSRSALAYSIVPPTSNGSDRARELPEWRRLHRARSQRPNTGRLDREYRSGDAAPPRARLRWALRCQCPCRDRPAPSRPTRFKRNSFGKLHREHTFAAGGWAEQQAHSHRPRQPCAAMSPCLRTSVNAIEADTSPQAQIVNVSG